MSSELDAYYQKEYCAISEWGVMLVLLEGLANEGPYREKHRNYVLDCYCYNETTLQIDYFRDVIRGKLEGHVTWPQAKEFLRLRYLPNSMLALSLMAQQCN